MKNKLETQQWHTAMTNKELQQWKGQWNTRTKKQPYNNRSTMKSQWSTPMKHENDTQQGKTTFKHINDTQHWKTPIVLEWKINETQEWGNNNCSTIIQKPYAKKNNEKRKWNTPIKYNNEEQHWNTAMTHSNDK